MTKKIFRSIICVAMIVLFASLFIASTFLYSYFNNLQTTRLKEELSLVEANVEKEGEEYLKNRDSSLFRFTLVAPSGDVIYDSSANRAEMENHLDREEISEAMKLGKGSSARYSATLTERTFYEATKLKNGNILRISVSQVTVGALMMGMMPAICAIILFSVIVALILSDKMAKSVVKPLSELDLENPAQIDTYEELTPIFSKINKQHKLIKSQIKELKRKSDEFEQITASMQEGLILLDKKGRVLSINEAAKRLLGADDTVIGRDFSAVERSADLNQAVLKALGGKHCSLRKEKGETEYQFVINSTESGGKIIGVIILCFDITQTAALERSRREFTANVSHELKTPLQSIIGSAELLENGLVKPEDTERFVGNIKKEAAYLVELINDIIRLSRLDEESEPLNETVDLYEVSKEVLDVLSAAAAKRRVNIALEGEKIKICGIRRYIYEIIYNLCDNAIRYNKEGGSAAVTIKKQGENAVISVSDTGIGIPKEEQSRIFERFYRVDKSHSKETGGTGLGLSIVKHAVLYHGGTLKLDSEKDCGTTVTVVL